MGQINLIVGQANQFVFYLNAVTGAGMDTTGISQYAEGQQPSAYAKLPSA
jgi:hypothetical protein